MATMFLGIIQGTRMPTCRFSARQEGDPPMTAPKDRRNSPGSPSVTGRRTANDNQTRNRDPAEDDLESYERPNRKIGYSSLEDAPDSPPRGPPRRRT